VNRKRLVLRVSVVGGLALSFLSACTVNLEPESSGQPIPTSNAIEESSDKCRPAPKADLRDCNLTGADLIGADLIGANLRNANLRGAKLVGAKLVNATVVNANLRYADLSDADLTNANLSLSLLDNTIFRRTNLTGANLRSTVLDTCTDFSGAILAGADFTGSRRYEQDFCR